MRHCMQAYGFAGRVFAVNRSGVPVFGWPAFASCSAIGEPVDAAYVCVPVEAVAEAIEDIGRAGIKAAIVLSSGYSETGPEGTQAQQALTERAAALGIRILGPNCLGFANIRERTAMTAIAPRGALLTDGRIALVCQSGATAAEIVEFTQQQGVALNFFAATGNEAQVSIADVVDYLVDDEWTRVIMIYAETIRDTRLFSTAARRAFAAGKAIVVLKAGSSEIAASVARAHTGSLVGDDRVFTAACEKLNIIRAHSLEDLVVTAGVLAHTGRLRPGGAGFASISGGACTLIGDLASTVSLPLPALQASTLARLREVLPDYASTLNPLDVTGAAVRDPGILENALSILGDDPGIAIRLCVLNLPHLEGMTTPTAEMLSAVGRGLSAGSATGMLVTQTLKPVTDVSRRLMSQHGIPAVTGGLDHAVRAIAHALWWSERHRTIHCAAETQRPMPAHAVATPRLSTEREVLSYLATFDVPVIPAQITTSPKQAVEAAQNFGGSVVLKICSPDIEHKTEMGGVKLRLSGNQQITDAWHDINDTVRARAPEARIEGIIVSPMRERGIELFVGVAQDADWGQVIAVGLGGVWVEALKDTALSPLPIDRKDALRMLLSLRGAKILQGYRGAPAADLNILADVVVNIGNAALALGSDAISFEVNPLLVDGTQVEALDGLVVLQSQSKPQTPEVG